MGHFSSSQHIVIFTDVRFFFFANLFNSKNSRKITEDLHDSSCWGNVIRAWTYNKFFAMALTHTFQRKIFLWFVLVAKKDLYSVASGQWHRIEKRCWLKEREKNLCYVKNSFNITLVTGINMTYISWKCERKAYVNFSTFACFQWSTSDS